MNFAQLTLFFSCLLITSSCSSKKTPTESTKATAPCAPNVCELHLETPSDKAPCACPSGQTRSCAGMGVYLPPDECPCLSDEQIKKRKPVCPEGQLCRPIPGSGQQNDALAPPTASPKAAATKGPAAGDQENALLETLRTMAADASDLEDLRVFFAFEDLNNDGVEEAVVHLSSPNFCGTGGCTTVVYQWDAKEVTYGKVAHLPTTQPPIYASEREGCLWSILWVQRSGGGQDKQLHSPAPLSDIDACDAPVGTWKESESKLLIPVYGSHAEGTAL